MRKILVAVIVGIAASIVPSVPASATPTWTLIYQTTNSARVANDYLQYSAGYEDTGTAVTNFTNSGKQWDLIRIRMEASLVSGGTLAWTDVYFDKWSGATLSQLQFPDYKNTLVLQRNITNLVIDSNYANVKKGSFALGRLEMWPYNYAQTGSGLLPAGSSSSYDWDDTPSVISNGHGSYQVHSLLVDTQTVLAWNMHRSGGTQEIGMGNSPSGGLDWTAQTTQIFNNTNFRVQVFVGLSVTAGTIAAPAFSGALKKGVKTTLTSITNGPGRVTFFYQGKRIAGCINKLVIDVSGTMTATCNFSPPSSGLGRIYAKYTASDSGYTDATSATVTTQVIRRTNLR